MLDLSILTLKGKNKFLILNYGFLFCALHFSLNEMQHATQLMLVQSIEQYIILHVKVISDRIRNKIR